jgi:hypothetical protein
MGSTQARVAKVESGTAREVSVEMMIRALYAAGGSLEELGLAGADAAPPDPPRRPKKGRRPGSGEVPATRR